jgi:hypothetical protein
MLKVLSLLLFFLVLVPISWYRRLTASSRFGLTFHRSVSSWDRGAIPATTAP